MFGLCAACLFSLILAGCAATNNSEWLSLPVDPPAPSVAAVTVVNDAAPEARPRLSRTVTLGESYADSTSAPASRAPADAPPVQVNVQTQVPVVVNNYAGYGYGAYGYGSYGYGFTTRTSGSSARGARSSEAKVGADFPPPPDYGPRALK